MIKVSLCTIYCDNVFHAVRLWSNRCLVVKIGFSVISLTHWGRIMHICIGNLTIISSDMACRLAGAEILLIGPLGTNFSQMLIKIHRFSFKKMHLEMSAAQWSSFHFWLNVLTHWNQVMHKFISKLGHLWTMACPLFSAKPLSKPMLDYC